MTSLTCTARHPASTAFSTPFPTRLWNAPAELLARERRLAIYGAALIALLLPMALAWGLDDRTLRGANV